MTAPESLADFMALVREDDEIQMFAMRSQNSFSSGFALATSTSVVGALTKGSHRLSPRKHAEKTKDTESKDKGLSKHTSDLAPPPKKAKGGASNSSAVEITLAAKLESLGSVEKDLAKMRKALTEAESRRAATEEKSRSLEH